MILSKKYLLIAFAPLLFIACEQQANNLGKKYFDIASLVNSQIETLQKENPKVKKQVLVNNKKESISTNNINWKHELELFLQADINKQAYLQSYDSVQTENSVIYKLKPTEKSTIKTVAITYHTSSPSRIEAIMQTNNYLYDSEKKISMNIENGKLKSYQMEGYQQLFIGDKKNFFVSGELVE